MVCRYRPKALDGVRNGMMKNTFSAKSQSVRHTCLVYRCIRDDVTHPEPVASRNVNCNSVYNIIKGRWSELKRRDEVGGLATGPLAGARTPSIDTAKMNTRRRSPTPHGGIKAVAIRNDGVSRTHLYIGEWIFCCITTTKYFYTLRGSWSWLWRHLIRISRCVQEDVTQPGLEPHYKVKVK